MSESIQLTKSAELLEKEKDIFQAYRQRCAGDFLCFVRGLRIKSPYGPRVFETVMAPHQRKDFEDIAESMHQLRDGEIPTHPRWWFERTKKASKDADLAIMILWQLCFAQRPFYSQVGAGDKGQASIVKERMTHLLHYNQWISELVEIVSWEVRSREMMISGQPLAKLDIMAADIAGAHGGTPDLLVINELTHITKWEFAQNLMDNADGVANGMVIVATNAGYKGTPADMWRKNAMANKRWQVSVYSKPAPWHDKEAIEDARTREASKSRFNRLWYGKWASGKGDALDEDMLEKCFTADGPHRTAKPGLIYVAGLDIGVHKDHTGLVVLGVSHIDRKIELAAMKRWEPGPGGVHLPDVRAELLRLNAIFRFEALVYDPSQGELLAQDIRPYMPTIRMPFTPTNCTLMATRFLQVVNNGFLDLYDDEHGRLRQDIAKFNIVEKHNGVKLEATSDASGHADVGTALIVCIPAAVEMLDGTGRLLGNDVIASVDDEPLTDEEVENLPPDLRGIFDMDAEDELDSFYKSRTDSLREVL